MVPLENRLWGMSTGKRNGEWVGCVPWRVSKDRWRALCSKSRGAATDPEQGCDHGVQVLGKMTMAALCRLLQGWRGGYGWERYFPKPMKYVRQKQGEVEPEASISSPHNKQKEVNRSGWGCKYHECASRPRCSVWWALLYTTCATGMGKHDN